MCGTKLMSAEVFIAKDSIDIGVSLALFDTPCPVNIQGFCYDKRFLVMEPSGPPSLIAVIQNWTAGLISQGRNAQCRPRRLEAKPLAAATDWLENYRRFWEEQFQRLDTLLDEMKANERERARKKR